MMEEVTSYDESLEEDCNHHGKMKIDYKEKTQTILDNVFTIKSWKMNKTTKILRCTIVYLENSLMR